MKGTGALCALLAAYCVATTVASAAGNGPAAKSSRPAANAVTLRGRVVPYKPALKRLFGIELVGNWGTDLLALETDAGELDPILPNDAGRFFYNDPRMHDRPMIVTARRYQKTPGLEVLTIQSVKDGKPHDIYYWCDICAIKMFHLKDCECCQGPVRIVEEPARERRSTTGSP